MGGETRRLWVLVITPVAPATFPPRSSKCSLKMALFLDTCPRPRDRSHGRATVGPDGGTAEVRAWSEPKVPTLSHSGGGTARSRSSVAFQVGLVGSAGCMLPPLPSQLFSWSFSAVTIQRLRGWKMSPRSLHALSSLCSPFSPLSHLPPPLDLWGFFLV